MQPDDVDCACVRDLETRETMAGFANEVACEVVDMVGGTCPPMVDYTLDELIARLVHVAVMAHDEALDDEDVKRTVEAVEKYALKLAKRLPSVVARIMEEKKQMESPNARH